MRRNVKYFKIILLTVTCIILCSCGTEDKNTENIPVITPSATSESTASRPTEEPTDIPTQTPTDIPTEVPTEAPEPEDDELVYIKDYIPDIIIDLKYASEDNFTGTVIYDFTEPQLRYGTVKKLISVQEEMKSKGYCLKLWDAYRPTEAQFKLWEICPNPTYVSDPTKGFSNHSRGNTVDVTIVKADGSEIEMPSGFDDFTEKANRDYSDVSEIAQNNVLILEKSMSEHGFKCYYGEWWHYTDSTTYPVVE